jgi:hypothetical protein
MDKAQLLSISGSIRKFIFATGFGCGFATGFGGEAARRFAGGVGGRFESVGIGLCSANGFELYPKSRDTAPVRDVIRRKKTPKRPRRPSSTLEVFQSPRSARGATPHNYGYAGMYLTFLGAPASMEA